MKEELRVEKIKIGIIGNGWRTNAYLRIVEELRDTFMLQGVLFRDTAKAAIFSQTHKGIAHTDINEFLNLDMDYVIISVARKAVFGYCETLFQRGIPVLCETPPADGMKQLQEAWNLKQKYNAKVQVLEQCHLFPYQAALQQVVNDSKTVLYMLRNSVFLLPLHVAGVAWTVY